MLSLSLTVGALALAAPVRGLGGPTTPAPALSVTIVSKVDATAETITLETTDLVARAREMTVAVPVKVDGKVRTVLEKRTVMEQVAVSRMTLQSVKGAHVFTGDGKELKDDARWDALKPRAAVLMGHGDALSPAWTKLLRADAVVLMLPTGPSAPVTPAPDVRVIPPPER